MNAGQVAGLGFLILVALSLISKDDFRTNIPWDSIVLIGCVVGLGAVIPALKIDAYIATQLGETIASLMCNMYIFTIALAIIIYLVRFLIVSQIAVVTIFMVLLTPFAVEAGVNPWIVGIILVTSVNIINVFYQNTTYIAAMSAVEGMTKFIYVKRMSYVYMISNIVALLISLPYWKLLGLY